jgi:hypothetical protein
MALVRTLAFASDDVNQALIVDLNALGQALLIAPWWTRILRTGRSTGQWLAVRGIGLAIAAVGRRAIGRIEALSSFTNKTRGAIAYTNGKGRSKLDVALDIGNALTVNDRLSAVGVDSNATG